MAPRLRFVLAFGWLAVSLAAQTAAPYRDPSLPIEVRLRDLLGRMTLEEKVAQLQGLRIEEPNAFDAQDNFHPGASAAILDHGAGSVRAGGDRDRFGRDPRQRLRRLNAIQKYMREKTRLGIPVFSFSESLHGYMALGATSFPQAIALGSTWDPGLIERVFAAAAQEESAAGVREVLSPVLDLAREPRWGRFEECFGEDPYLVAQIGLAAIYGLQGRGPLIDAQHVAVSLKHFAGHGQPEGGRNTAPVDIPERQFRSDHLYPFEVAVKVGHAHAVMASYNDWDGVPNHINHKLLTDILRTEWGFDGFVMSDGSGMDMLYKNHLAAANPDEAGVLSIAAGLDYDLGGPGRCFANLADDVRRGRVAQASIDRAVSGVLRVKFLCGLFDHAIVDPAEMGRVTNTAEHRALARKAADEAMILLNNQGHLLPFDATKIKTLAVIGPNAAEVHLGDYSAVPMGGVSVLQGIKDFAGTTMKVVYAEGCKLTANHVSGWLVNENPVLNDAADDSRLIDEAVAVALRSDAIVLVLGENELLRREAWDSHLGDRDTLDLVGRQHELARAILATGKPVAVLLINGGPLSVNDLKTHAPALIECWYLGEETGPAVADVLFGRVSPGGKLTVTIPASVGQLPVYYDHQPSRYREYVLADSTPLYPFGFGLSYANFSYKNLQVSPAKIPATGSAQVSVEVTNGGKVRADEVVQLYIHAVVSVPVRPVEELKDFARVALDPGETRTVTFQLTPEKLASVDLAMHRTVQPGDFEVLVGTSSVDVLKGALRVE
jgi:beta-glucosidase